MNLADMATFVCTDMGLYDDTSIALCKAFLSKNYAQLWDKYPWKDTSGYGNAQVNAGIAVVDYPAGMDRIITLRATIGPNISPPTNLPDVPDMPDDPTVVPPSQTDSWFLDPIDSTFLIESEPRIYEDRGVIKYYEEIGNRANRQIRLYPIPIRGTSLFFNGKMLCPGLSNDTDEAAIRNIDPTLIAYAYADMLQRQRQYGKADIKRKEGLDLETNAWNLEQQQANLPRRTKATTVAGNSLTEMTDAVCMICGQWTPQYRLIIREFLRRNYQSLYDSFLWPEGLVVVRVPFTTEQVVLPEYVDKVIGVRGADDRRLFSADASLFLDLDPTIFDQTGTPIGYTTLTPVGVSSLPNTTTKLILASTNAADTSEVMLRGEILATGSQVEETISLNGTTPVVTFWSYDIPLTISKNITLGIVTVNAQSNGAGLLQLLPYQRESKHQRLWFLPAPGQGRAYLVDSSDDGPPDVPDTTIQYALILGKRAIRPLLSDEDTPIITGAQQVLIAAAAGDVFQKLEKADLSTALTQKASAAMDVLKDKNTAQANQPQRTKITTAAGNSLTEMSDAVCTICGTWLPEHRASIAEFMRRSYQRLYDGFLWPESLVVVSVPYTTDNVVIPEFVDKVIAVRGADDQRLFSADGSLFLDLDPTIFDRTGEAIGYTTLTPVGVDVLPSASTRLVLASTSSTDKTRVMLRGEVFATGTEVEEYVILNGTTPVYSYWLYDVPFTVAKDITNGLVTVTAQVDHQLLLTLLPYRREAKHQRIRLMPAPGINRGAFADSSDPGIPSLPDDPDVPPVTRHCLVLGKRAIRPLLVDQDTPIITGAQHVLIADAAAGLFQTLEKSDLATSMQQKADAATDALKEKNTEQANQPRRTKITTAAGNTLAEMTDAVCTICGQWTPEYRASIAEFMRRNYQALYDSFLWPESLVGVGVPYTTGNVIVPEFIDKILSVRGNSNNRLSPADIGLIMDIRPESLSEFGDPLTFTMTTPVAVDKLPSATTKLVLASTNDSDVSQVMLRGQVLATGGTEVEEGIFLKGTTPVTSFWSYDIPLTIAKDITNGFLTVRSLVDNELILSLAPYRREAKHQRFVLYPLPDPRLLAPGQTYQCLIFGKRSIRPLLVDQDSPIITGAQQVLIAGAAADLFMKLEKPDMATAFQQKAGASTEVLKAKNTDQAASASRFVPQIEPRAYFYDTYCGKW